MEALSSPHENLLGRVLGGAYKIESRLDEGGMGLVYQATHVRLKRQVAVKVMAAHLADDDAALARFTREAEIISQLSHPHIVQVLDFDTTDAGQPYLVMEMLQGRPLDALLLRRGKLEPAPALSIVIQAASALAAAHRAGIVHRDLKPANIFLVDSGDQLFVKLLDFGISKRAGEQSNPAARKLTGEFDILGTPDYMAPEQALGKTAHVDHRGDQYALAVILYEMLAGTVPFQAEDTMSLLQRVIRDIPAAPSTHNPNIPESVDAAILRALAKEPEDRWPSVSDFSEVLEIAAAEYRLISLPNLGRDSQPPAARSGISPDTDPQAHTARFEEESGMKTNPGRRAAAQRPRQGSSSVHGSPTDSSHGDGNGNGGSLSRSGSVTGPRASSGDKEDPRHTSWHSKDPVRAVHQLVERSRQELGLDNLELAVSCAESALEILRITGRAEVEEVISKNQTLFNRVFERRLGRLTSAVVVQPSAGLTGSGISPEQAYLLSRLDGGVSLGDALDLSPFPRMQTLGYLVGFLRSGHIRIN